MDTQTPDQIADTLGRMSIEDILALTKTLEQRWGVSAAPPVQQAKPQEQTAPTTTPEQTEYDVILVAVPAAKKIAAIKAVREATSLGLAEAKAFVDSVPKTMKEGLPKAEAEALKAKFVELGAEVELK